MLLSPTKFFCCPLVLWKMEEFSLWYGLLKWMLVSPSHLASLRLSYNEVKSDLTQVGLFYISINPLWHAKNHRNPIDLISKTYSLGLAFMLCFLMLSNFWYCIIYSLVLHMTVESSTYTSKLLSLWKAKILSISSVRRSINSWWYSENASM